VSDESVCSIAGRCSTLFFSARGPNDLSVSGSYRVNKLIAVPLSPGHAHSVLARGSTLHVRAYDCIPLQSQYSHVLLTYLQQVFPVHNNKLFRSAWTLSECDTTSENPSTHHHHTMSHRPIIAAHDPRPACEPKLLFLINRPTQPLLSSRWRHHTSLHACTPCFPHANLLI
jgi:hypothetical protein